MKNAFWFSLFPAILLAAHATPVQAQSHGGYYKTKTVPSPESSLVASPCGTILCLSGLGGGSNCSIVTKDFFSFSSHSARGYAGRLAYLNTAEATCPDPAVQGLIPSIMAKCGKAYSYKACMGASGDDEAAPPDIGVCGATAHSCMLGQEVSYTEKVNGAGDLIAEWSCGGEGMRPQPCIAAIPSQKSYVTAECGDYVRTCVIGQSSSYTEKVNGDDVIKLWTCGGDGMKSVGCSAHDKVPQTGHASKTTSEARAMSKEACGSARLVSFPSSAPTANLCGIGFTLNGEPKIIRTSVGSAVDPYHTGASTSAISSYYQWSCLDVKDQSATSCMSQIVKQQVACGRYAGTCDIGTPVEERQRTTVDSRGVSRAAWTCSAFNGGKTFLKSCYE